MKIEMTHRPTRSRFVFPITIMKFQYSPKTLKEEINFCLSVPQTMENDRVLLECFNVGNRILPAGIDTITNALSLARQTCSTSF
jgi:hypothetical protein